MPHIAPNELLTIGEIAKRAGVTVPALRYYEERRLIDAIRTPGGHRVFPRHTLRRLAVIAAGQRIGLSLQQIAHALDELPRDRPPTQRDWTHMSRNWARLVTKRIEELQHLATDLDGCIGCGCLSLGKCTLFNRDDEASGDGTGARWVRAAQRMRG